MRATWSAIILALSLISTAQARDIGQSGICLNEYGLKGPCVENNAISVVGNFFSDSLEQGKPSTKAGAKLVYRVCNLNRHKKLYFIWNSAGYWSGALDDGQVEFQSCAEYSRQAKTAAVTTTERVRINRRHDLIGVDTVHDEPEGVAAVFNFATEIGIRPLSTELSLPTNRTVITTRRNEKKGPVQVIMQLPHGHGLCIALPKMSNDSEQDILKTVRSQGFTEPEAKILGAADKKWDCFKSDEDRENALNAIGNHSVLYLFKKGFEKSEVGFSFKSNSETVGDLFATIFEPNAKTNRFVFRYTVVTSGE